MWQKKGASGNKRTLMAVPWGERMGIARGRTMVLSTMVLSTMVMLMMVLQRVCSLAFCLGWNWVGM